MDLKDCVVYLVYQLRANGFEIRFTYPNMLYISWAHYENDYLMNKNPIVQAMTPPKTEIVTKKGGLKNDRGPAPPIQNPYTDMITVTPARSASDYTPPNSFLDTLQRPLPNASKAIAGAGNVVADLWKFI